jgi:hypothetical protein
MKKIVFTWAMCSVFLFHSCSNEPESPIPSNGLVAHYTFNGGNADDKSGNNNHGTISMASFTSDRFGEENESVLFNSEDDFIKVTNPSFLDSDKGTFVAWVKFQDIDHTQYIASVGDEGSIDNYISFIRLDGVTHTLGIYQREPAAANWVDGSTVITEDTYYHVVMRSDGQEWSIYINGNKETLSIRGGSNAGKWISQLNSIDNFVIGSSIILPPYTIPYMSGIIDEVLMYDRPLSESEIRKLYNNTKP